MYKKTVLDITAELGALGRQNHMVIVFERPFSGDIRLRLHIDCTGFKDAYMYDYPHAFDSFKARFESYLENYLCETEKAVNEIAARTYAEIDRACKDSDPFVTVIVD